MFHISFDRNAGQTEDSVCPHAVPDSNNLNHDFDGHILACPLLKSASTRKGLTVVLSRSAKNLLHQNSRGLKCARFRASFGAESEVRLAPDEIDKPKPAEILPFQQVQIIPVRQLITYGYPVS